jgi:hypothetical protein
MLLPMAPAKYLAALGRFVHAFSWVEDHVAILLWITADVQQPTAQALLSGVKIEQAISLLGRVMDAREISGPDREALEEALRQVSLINKVRNEILHFGAKAQQDGRLVISNQRTAHINSRLREVTISPETLADMTYDLDAIWVRLHVYGWRLRSDHFDFSQSAGHAERLERPWRYRPPQQAASTRKTQKTPPAQQLPPPTSGG